MPSRVFSGKSHPDRESKAVFFCFALPAPSARLKEGERQDAAAWTEDAGYVKWYLYDLVSEQILEEPSAIHDLIRCNPETQRRHEIPDATLSDIRSRIEKHIKNTYLKQVQAPIGVRSQLKCWMELS
jgi:hypothetical protein